MNNICEVVVVEGYHDLSKVKGVFPNVDVVITNGSEISEETLNELKILNETRGLILLLDPDYQGERIRNIINEHVGPTKHIFLRKEDTISKNKKKVGVEHASDEIIEKSFSNILTFSNLSQNYTINFLFDNDLIGSQKSKEKRKILCDNLGIGLCNGKTLLKKLNMFQVPEEKILEILKGVV